MGSVTTIRCEKCKYKKELFLGQGMTDCLPDSLASSFGGTYESVIKPLLKHGVILNLHRELGYCAKCNSYEAVPVIDISLPSGDRSIKKKCDECGGEYELFLQDDTLKKCPECGDILKTEDLGLWD